MDDVEDEEDAEETPDEDAGAKKRKACSPLYVLFATCPHRYFSSAPLLNPKRPSQLPRRLRFPDLESRRAKPRLMTRMTKIRDVTNLENKVTDPIADIHRIE
jgi:hypothetical protein